MHEVCMAYKPLWNWMDKMEGKKKGTSLKKLKEEINLRQGNIKCGFCGRRKTMKGSLYCKHCLEAEDI